MMELPELWIYSTWGKILFYGVHAIGTAFLVIAIPWLILKRGRDKKP